MSTIKQLPVSPRTKVFRAITGILAHDPVLSSVVRPPNFRTWSGASHDTIDFTFSSTPSIRITPTNGPDTWKFPDALPGAAKIVAKLQQAGAYSGLCEFSQPAFDASPQDRFFAATGQIKIEVILQVSG